MSVATRTIRLFVMFWLCLSIAWDQMSVEFQTELLVLGLSWQEVFDPSLQWTQSKRSRAPTDKKRTRTITKNKFQVHHHPIERCTLIFWSWSTVMFRNQSSTSFVRCLFHNVAMNSFISTVKTLCYGLQAFFSILTLFLSWMKFETSFDWEMEGVNR